MIKIKDKHALCGRFFPFFLFKFCFLHFPGDNQLFTYWRQTGSRGTIRLGLGRCPPRDITSIQHVIWRSPLIIIVRYHINHCVIFLMRLNQCSLTTHYRHGQLKNTCECTAGLGWLRGEPKDSYREISPEIDSPRDPSRPSSFILEAR